LPIEGAVAARCEDLVKTYRTATGEVRALRGITETFPSGALTAVVGPSGSGKSSLLRLLAGLDHPTSGTIRVGDIAVERASGRTLRRFRRTVVGYLFQRPSDNFLPHLTVADHLRLAGRLTHRPPRIAPQELLETLGIAHRLDHRPSELSGGEQQRAAIAEVLMGGAETIVADEPTAELDSASARHVLDTIRLLVDAGVTFVLATHDAAVMRRADEALELDHGVRRSRPSGGGPGTFVDRVAAAPTPADELEPPILLADGISKTYRRGEEVVHALEDVEVRLRQGELVGLIGRSGSGKTTLLNVIAGWERPDAGRLERPGEDAPGWTDIAVVPQKLGLLEELTVRENVEHPLRLAGVLDDRDDRAEELLERLGLAHLQDRQPRETSLGEQQRAAVARALVRNPRLLLADEPTGHQDAGFANVVFEALRDAAAQGTACLVATHNEQVVPHLDRVLHIADGRLT
jgi:ABC-type lipoprotein export system ATPase subunit